MSGRSAWLRRRPETFWVQAGCGLTTCAWGLYLLTMDVPMRDMAVYDEAVRFVPPWAWARFAVVVGLLQAVCAIGGQWWAMMQSWPRRVTGLLVMTYWLVFAVSMWNSGEPTAMPVILCGFALMNSPVVLLPLLRQR